MLQPRNDPAPKTFLRKTVNNHYRWKLLEVDLCAEIGNSFFLLG
jgi:hypothetical protein